MNEDPLIGEVAAIGSLVLVDEWAECGILATDRIAHIIRASIETYLIFSTRTRSDPSCSP